MNETSKSHQLRIYRKDYDRFLKPNLIGVDIGGGSDPLKSAHGLPYPTYDIDKGDAQYLDKLTDNTIDFIYSSHCLEHLVNLDIAMANWNRVLKRGGFIYITVPDFTIYEHHNWPSKYNGDHKQTFSLSLSRKFIGRENHFGPAELSDLFRKAGLKVVRMEMEDLNFNYSDRTGKDQTMENAMAQFSIVLKKPLPQEHVPGVLLAGEFENFVCDFAGGLGDAINTVYRTKRYSALENITKRVHIVLRCHNPFVNELFLYHPKRHLFIIHDLAAYMPSTVNHYYHDMNHGKKLYAELGLPIDKVLPDADYTDTDVTSDKLEKVNLYCSKTDKALIETITKNKYAVVQPFAGVPGRNIPKSTLIDMINQLTKKNLNVVLVGKSYTRALKNEGNIVPSSEHDYERTDFIAELKHPNKVIDLIDADITVPGTILLTQSASIFLGSHSSMNLAAWYARIPNIILYGDLTKQHHFTKPDQWSFGIQYEETRHGLFLEYNSEWIEELLKK